MPSEAPLKPTIAAAADTGTEYLLVRPHALRPHMAPSTLFWTTDAYFAKSVYEVF